MKHRMIGPMMGGIVVLMASACGTRPRPALTVPPQADAPVAEKSTAKTTAFESSTVCQDPESSGQRTRSVSGKGNCCAEVRPPLAATKPFQLGHHGYVRVGHAGAACGPEPLPSDASREHSLNPSEQLRPGAQVIELGW